MSSTIKALLEKEFPISITKAVFQNLIRYLIMFETRDKNALALNSPYLGVIPVFFTNQDQDMFFDIFNTNGKEFTKYLKKNNLDSLINGLQRGELKKLIVKLDAVDSARKVQSDPFNIFITYVIYKVVNTAAKSIGISDKEKDNLLIAIFKIFQYKFFTSLVNHRFRYKADENVMQATVNSLSNKFAITKYGTWKKVIEARAEELISDDSIHKDTISKYDDDVKILYLITDTQTRIRNQINIVTSAYYVKKEQHDEVASYGITGNDIEGEKIVVDQVSVFDSMTSNLTNEMMSVHQFITPELITLMCKMHTNIRYDLFKSVLVKFSEKALLQARAKTTDKGLDEIQSINNQDIYLGLRIFVAKTIQKSYRYCIQNNVNMNSKVEILKAIKDVYSSSRINDPNILSIRDSAAVFIDGCNISRRPATVTSLKIALILYIIVKSFRYL